MLELKARPITVDGVGYEYAGADDAEELGFRITLPFTFRLGNAVGLLAFQTRPFERDSEHSPYMRSER